MASNLHSLKFIGEPSSVRNRVKAPDSLRNSARRAGSLLIEATVALAIVAVLAVVVVELMTWSLRERARLASQQAALQLAANLLEEARAEPVATLTQAWAESRTIPPEIATRLPEGKVVVLVKSGETPRTRQVKVEVHWQTEAIPQSVALTTVLSERTTKKAGGQP